MDKINLKTFTSNSRKLSGQKFCNYLTCEFTAHFACRSAEINLKSTTTPGGGRYSKNVCTGRLRPEVQPLTLLYHCTIFHKKSTPFVHLLLTNGTPFTYLVQNFVSLLTAVNALSFKQKSITKIERFFDFIKL